MDALKVAWHGVSVGASSRTTGARGYRLWTWKQGTGKDFVGERSHSNILETYLGQSFGKIEMKFGPEMWTISDTPCYQTTQCSRMHSLLTPCLATIRRPCHVLHQMCLMWEHNEPLLASKVFVMSRYLLVWSVHMVNCDLCWAHRNFPTSTEDSEKLFNVRLYEGQEVERVIR